MTRRWSQNDTVWWTGEDKVPLDEEGILQRVSKEICKKWVSEPDSAFIALALNDQKAKVCIHERDPCYLRCGVRRVNGVWEQICKEERLRWLESMMVR